MKSLTRYITTLFVIIGCSLSVSANNAASLLDKAAQKFQQAKSITADFTISGNGNLSSGNIAISGDRFKIKMNEISIWYDGRTQWTYSQPVNEISITEPTPDELQQVNPFAIISAFRKAYSATTLNNGNNIATLQLTPLSSHDEAISKVVLTLNKSTLFPTQIVLTLDNGESITIKVISVKIGNTLPLSTFTYNELSYPNAEIIDLR